MNTQEMQRTWHEEISCQIGTAWWPETCEIPLRYSPFGFSYPKIGQNSHNQGVKTVLNMTEITHLHCDLLLPVVLLVLSEEIALRRQKTELRSIAEQGRSWTRNTCRTFDTLCALLVNSNQVTCVRG